MASIVFVSFFAAIGLAVVLVAMRGGPRGVRETLEHGRRQPLRAVEFGLFGAMVVFGLVIPAIVLLSDQAAAGPGGTKLSPDLKEGRKMFNAKCSQCHTLEDAGAVGRVGPDLDILAPTEGLTLDAINKGRARGQGQMPSQLLDGDDARNVAKYVAAVAGR